MNNFGTWLYVLRKKAALTQQELADRAGTSKNYVSVLERNLPDHRSGAVPQPSRRVVEGLARGLAVPLAEALEAAGYAPPRGEDENCDAIDDAEVLRYFHGVPPALRPRVKKMIQAMMDETQEWDEGRPYGRRTKPEESNGVSDAS